MRWDGTWNIWGHVGQWWVSGPYRETREEAEADLAEVDSAARRAELVDLRRVVRAARELLEEHPELEDGSAASLRVMLTMAAETSLERPSSQRQSDPKKETP